MEDVKRYEVDHPMEGVTRIMDKVEGRWVADISSYWTVGVKDLVSKANDYAALKARVTELEKECAIREAYEAEFGKLEELRERIAKTTDAEHLAQLVTNRARDYAKADRDSLKSRVAELEQSFEDTLKEFADERCDLRAQLDAAIAERTASVDHYLRREDELTAQLEAANDAIERVKEFMDRDEIEAVIERPQLTAQPLTPLSDYTEDQLKRMGQQLTAQPDGVRLREALPERPITSLAYCASRLSPDQVLTVQRMVKQMDAYADALEAALSAAPAQPDGVRSMTGAVKMAVNVLRRNASERGLVAQAEVADALELALAQALAAPAPAPVCSGLHCAQGGDCPKCDADLIAKMTAPACKTCGDRRKVSNGFVGDADDPSWAIFELFKPCPDCAKGEL